MSLTGKNALSLRKKDVRQQKSTAIGFKKLQFAHKATAGETGIDTGSLSLPSEMGSLGFTNPNVSDITASNMFFHRKNVSITSSLSGVLIQDLSYTIKSSTRINFEFTPADGEIFVVTIDHSPSNGIQVVDAAPIAVSGELAIGVTDFNVGTPFRVGQTPQKIMVTRNGLVQVRNTGNSSTVLDGNYYEVDLGDGTGVIIRFNNAPVGQADSIAAFSIGSLVEKPTASQLAEIEKVQGQIDAMVPTLASTAGVPTTTFQAAPNNVDLKAFGDRVLDNESKIANLESDITRNFQTRILTGNRATTTVIDESDLRFVGLTIGKAYTVRGKLFADAPTTTGNAQMEVVMGGAGILKLGPSGGSGVSPGRAMYGGSITFIATATSLTVNFSLSASCTILGNGALDQTWVQLVEEVEHITETSKWTP